MPGGVQTFSVSEASIWTCKTKNMKKKYNKKSHHPVQVSILLKRDVIKVQGFFIAKCEPTGKQNKIHKSNNPTFCY